MHRRKAAGISAMVRRAMDAGRWQPTHDEAAEIFCLERALALRIQSGQTELADMQTSLIADGAETVLSIVRSATVDGRFMPSMRDRRMLKVATLHVVPGTAHDTLLDTLAA